MSLDHEHRGRPLVAAYGQAEDAAPEPPRHRAPTHWWQPSWAVGGGRTIRDWSVGAGRTVRAWVAAEWKLLALYLGAAAFAFIGVAVSQHYWPNETLAIWGTIWRPALICTGAVTIVLLAFEMSVRSPKHQSHCYTCGAEMDGADQ